MPRLADLSQFALRLVERQSLGDDRIVAPLDQGDQAHISTLAPPRVG
jgi:hypothetical protein